MICRKLLRAGFALALLAAPLMASAVNNTVSVSTNGYNRFTFNSPFEAVVLPPQAPLESDPVALGANTTLLLDFSPGITEPVQMVVQMADGGVYDMMLMPGAPRPAAWEQPGGPSSAKAYQRPGDANLVGIFQEVLANPIAEPDGFKSLPTPSAQASQGLTADYIAAYEGKTMNIYVMRLRADKPSPILPQDLYVNGLISAYIEGDAVGPNLAPLAVVLMAKEG